MEASGPVQDEAEGVQRRGFRPSIARTLTWGFGSLMVASLGLSLYFAFKAAWQNTLELERALADLTVEAVAGEIDTHLGAAKDQVAFVSEIIERGEVDIRDEERLTDLMVGALAATPQVSGIALVRADYSVLRAGLLDGELVSRSGDWAHRDDIRETMANAADLQEPSWRTVGWVEEFDAPHIIVAEPVVRDGELLGLMFSIVSVGALSGFLDKFDRTSGTHSFILYGRDQVLAHPSLAGGYPPLSEDKPLPLLADLGDEVLAAVWGEVIDDMDYFLADSALSGHVVRGNDDDYIYFYRELEVYDETPWLVGIYFRGHEIDVPLRRIRDALALGAVILAIALFCGWRVARSIVRPLENLAGASQSVRRLDLRGVQPLGGSPFSELDVAVKAFDSMLAGLKSFETYVPKSLVLRLMASGGSSVQSEEREVTVLFTDIVDFTRIGARLAPARLAALLNEHFTLLGEAIEAEEGTVDKYIGDSIMAFWGAPLDQPDHAARACRAARSIARRLDAENARRRAAGEEPLKLRVGIHSGPAIVGNIGAPGRVNYTMIGDTVNVAQRLEALGKEVCPEAEVAVLISRDTRAALDGGFETEGLGPFVLRGREAPLEVFRLNLSAGGEQQT